jgi:hypothetical protein
VRRVLFALLLSGCAQRGELLVSPDATLSVESDHVDEVAVKAGKPARFDLPTHGTYKVFIRAPGRATVFAWMGGADCTSSYYTTTSNSSCKSKEDDARGRGRHPFTWLRGPGGAPFELPSQGQGFIVTTDSPNVTVRVDSTTATPYADHALVFPLSVGRHTLSADDGKHKGFYEDMEIEANVYRFIHVQIGSATPGVGGSWNR